MDTIQIDLAPDVPKLPAGIQSTSLRDYIANLHKTPAKYAELRTYLGYWAAINDAQMGRIPAGVLKNLIEDCFGKKLTCSNCGSVFTAAQRAFENKTFTKLWTEYSFIMPRLDTEIFAHTALGTIENYNGINCGGYFITDEWRTRLTTQHNKARQKELAIVINDELTRWKSVRLRFFDSKEYANLLDGFALYEKMIAPVPPRTKVNNHLPVVSPDQLVALRAQGLTYTQIAEKVGVSESKLYQLKKRHKL